MRKECPRAADSFLLAVGELGLGASLRAYAHTLVCRACRIESRELRNSAKLISSTVGTSAVASVPLKIIFVKVVATALSVVTVAGLWYAGREAVGAAMASNERPQLRNSNYEPDEMPSKRAND